VNVLRSITPTFGDVRGESNVRLASGSCEGSCPQVGTDPSDSVDVSGRIGRGEPGGVIGIQGSFGAGMVNNSG
jgi:hypothetical protein